MSGGMGVVVCHCVLGSACALTRQNQNLSGRHGLVSAFKNLNQEVEPFIGKISTKKFP